MDKKRGKQPRVRVEDDGHGNVKVATNTAKNRNKSMYGRMESIIKQLELLKEDYPAATGVCILQSASTNKFLRTFVNFQGADEVWCQQLSTAIQTAVLTKCTYPSCALNTQEFTSTLDRPDIDRFLHQCYENGIISRNQHVEMVKFAMKYAKGAANGCVVS